MVRKSNVLPSFYQHSNVLYSVNHNSNVHASFTTLCTYVFVQITSINVHFCSHILKEK